MTSFFFHSFPSEITIFPWFSPGFPLVFPWFTAPSQAASDGSLTPAEVLALKMSFEDIDKTLVAVRSVAVPIRGDSRGYCWFYGGLMVVEWDFMVVLWDLMGFNRMVDVLFKPLFNHW